MRCENFNYFCQVHDKKLKNIYPHRSSGVCALSQLKAGLRPANNENKYEYRLSGIIEKAEDYLYSGARNYAGMSGLITDLIIILVTIEKMQLMRSVK